MTTSRNRITASSLDLSSLYRRALMLMAGASQAIVLLLTLMAGSGQTSFGVGVVYLMIALQVATAVLLIEWMRTQPSKGRLAHAPEINEPSEMFFHALARHSQMALWMALPGWQRFLYVSPACAAVWGRDAAPMLADPAIFWEALHPDDRARMQAATAQLSNGEYTIEYRIFRPDGTLRWVEMHIFPVCDAAGALAYVAGIALDVTARKLREEERLAQERRAQEVRRQASLNILASGVAHNFNNLLQIILGYIDLSLDTLPIGAPAHSLIAPIQVAGERAAALTRQMLAFSGKGHSLMQPLLLNDVLATAADSLGSPTNDTITMDVQLDPRLPPIKADTSQIQQVVQHLVTNAVESIGAGPGGIVVRTSLRHHAEHASLATMLPAPDLPEGDYVTLEVADTGCGMGADTRAQMFEPFFSTKFAGRGLGLAAVLGIVRDHGGGIDVTSEPGQGTTITVLFPPTPTIEIAADVWAREDMLC